MMLIKYSGFCAALLLALAACAPIKPRPAPVADEAAQALRESELASRPAWAFSGRLAVSQDGDGGNARIQWRQEGKSFDIRLSAPITRQSWRLVSDGSGVRLEGLEEGVRRGTDAQAMLQEATGWTIPLGAMAAWVRGARAEGANQLASDNRGLPATIVQDGWTVEYRDWSQHPLPLPQRVFARQGQASVKLVIEQWETP